MKVLLDTHVFLWYIAGDARLPATMAESLADAQNLVYLSSISLLEIIIKDSLMRLRLSGPPELFIPEQRRLHEIETLAVDEAIRQYDVATMS